MVPILSSIKGFLILNGVELINIAHIRRVEQATHGTIEGFEDLFCKIFLDPLDFDEYVEIPVSLHELITEIKNATP